MKPVLLVATANPGKAKEIRGLLRDVADVQTLADHPDIVMPEETGQTFGDNARDKAEYVHGKLGVPVLADDSGLSVDALDGAPGVRSARYASGSDAARYEHLLGVLAEVPDDRRTARFECSMAFAAPGLPTRIEHGTVEGRIGRGPNGSGGFGYDPVFVLPEGRTMAQLPAEEKGTISHRGRALRSILPYVIDYFSLVPGEREP